MFVHLASGTRRARPSPAPVSSEPVPRTLSSISRLIQFFSGGLLRQTRLRKATDPRDKVYGILALVTLDHERIKLLPVDYSISILDLYVKACAACMGAQGEGADLAFLGAITYSDQPSIARNQHKDNSWPSWVPDLTLPEESAFINEVHVGSMQDRGCSVSGSRLSNAIILRDHPHTFQRRRRFCLRASAIRLLCVQAFLPSSARDGLDEYCKAFGRNRSYYANIKSESLGPYQYLLNPLPHTGTPIKSPPLVRTYWEHINLCASFEALSATELERSEIPKQLLLSAEEIRNRRQFLELGPIEGDGHTYVRMHGFIPLRLPKDLGKRVDKEEDIGKEFHVQNAKLFVTGPGFVGCAPSSARVGDEIAIILGAPMPFVIRRDVEDHYLLIGQCFILGLMNGEAMEGLDEQRVEDLHFW